LFKRGGAKAGTRPVAAPGDASLTLAPAQAQALERCLVLTVNGVAASLQNIG
jgi:hypothetical protein